jgi:hypothetical protein
MTENLAYKPVGGLLRAELFALEGLSSAEDMVSGAGVEVSLMDDGSSYEELHSAEGLPVSVQHTLTLCSDRNQAREWFDEQWLAHLASEGVAARVTLSTGEQIVLGYSERFGFEQALRLQSLKFLSGKSPNDSPRVQLVLRSLDTQSALR